MTSQLHERSAGISSFKTIDGKELALKFDNLDNYKGPSSSFLGASIGRVANRIYGGSITVEGKEYPLVRNDKDQNATLHGGPKGWDKFDWSKTESTNAAGHKVTTFTHVSPHLDQGFPGEVTAKAIYTQYTKGDKAYLEIEYEATLAENSPVDETVVSLTNHNYFDVAQNHTTYDGLQIKVATNKYIAHGSDNVPTGEIAEFAAVPKDLSFFTLSKEGPYIDHAFALQPFDKFTKLDTRGSELALNVHLHHPVSKVNVQVYSTEPVFQVYTGDGMNIPKLDGEKRQFPGRSGVAVEPARPTNAANRPEWRPWVTLKKGDTYGSKIVYVNWVGQP